MNGRFHTPTANIKDEKRIGQSKSANSQAGVGMGTGTYA